MGYKVAKKHSSPKKHPASTLIGTAVGATAFPIALYAGISLFSIIAKDEARTPIIDAKSITDAQMVTNHSVTLTSITEEVH